MIDTSKLNSNFLQHGGSCVLASYALVYNYFTGRPVESCFEAYCRHFGIPFTDWRDAERKYAAHFDAEWKKRKCPGYEVIIDLHDHSGDPIFQCARAAFATRFYLNAQSELDDIERQLRENEAILNITYQRPGQDCHSITVGAESTGRLIARDTNKAGISPLPALSALSVMRDGVLYTQKAH